MILYRLTATPQKPVSLAQRLRRNTGGAVDIPAPRRLASAFTELALAI
jgi:hypothetical protein